MNDLRQLHGNEIATMLIPTTVTLITARPCGEKGEEGDRVATVAWAMPISHEPSLIAVSIRPHGSTARAIARAGAFIVNVLGADDASTKIATICGDKHAQADRYATAQLTVCEGKRVDAPRVEQAISWIECELVDHTIYGDHELFVGRTLLAETRGLLDDNGKLVPQPALLMGQRGCFGHFEEGFSR